MTDKVTIVKIGGKVTDDESTLNVFLDSFVACPGHKILIHGGGKTAENMLKRLGMTPVMVDGRRVTDAGTLEVVTMVYGGLVNKNIVGQLQKRKCNSLGMTGVDLNVIVAEKRPVAQIDYGYAGDIKAVEGKVLFQLLNQQIVPVLCSITHDGNGQLLNTNADTIATEVAKAMKRLGLQVRLLFCFERKGVVKQAEGDEALASINKKEYEEGISAGYLTGGILPKLKNAFEASEFGVEEVRICHFSEIEERNAGTLIYS